MVGGIRKPRPGAGDAHHVGDEGGRPGVVAVLVGREHRAGRIVLAGPGGFRRAGVHPQPPVFADALPQAGLAFRLVLRRRRRARAGRIVIDRLAEQPPFAQRDRHHGFARDRFVGHARERRHVGIGTGVSARHTRTVRGSGRQAASRATARKKIHHKGTKARSFRIIFVPSCLCGGICLLAEDRTAAGITSASRRTHQRRPRDRSVLQPADQPHHWPEQQEIRQRRRHDRRRVVGDALRLARLEQQFRQRNHTCDRGQLHHLQRVGHQVGQHVAHRLRQDDIRHRLEWVSPVPRAASIWPAGTLSMPARRTSP